MGRIRTIRAVVLVTIAVTIPLSICQLRVTDTPAGDASALASAAQRDIRAHFAIGVNTAHAEPQRLAIVNLARGEQQRAGATLAARLRRTLTRRAQVAPLPAGNLSRALEDAATGSDTSAADLRAAGEALNRARENLAQFDYTSALRELDAAEQRLLAAWPSPASARLLADAAFERGRIAMRQRSQQRARRAFLHSHRLDPERSLDPERYLPEEVQTFAEVASEHAAMEPSVELVVTGLLDGAAVYIDGSLAGHTPLRAQVAPGPHYVAGTFAERALGGQRIDADGGSAEIKLYFGTVTVDERARHWRRARLDELDDAAAEGGYGGLAAAELPERQQRQRVIALGNELIGFSGADAALLIADDAEGALRVAVYLPAEQRVSEFAASDAESVRQLLDTYLGSARDVQRPTLSFPGPSVPERDGPPWYRRPVYQALLNVGIVLSAAVIFNYAVLDRPNSVGGTCCTLGATRNPRAFGFSF
ncbi:hypothetical protein Hoch_2675 [Haliangium ochraceum DSM 14365]|uniref:PEGA domain-containing protein n=1 Tax=Haliangium ochraceum (strain DSM 14365 / JCM 11303 / SMP-2) TaxID=502025 RepID=D0LM28_HALO1|nr:hypothetical protein Hoch_2675 [Haliangium ochraceum DSM 14365]